MPGPAAFAPAPTTTVIAPQPLSAGMHTAPHFDLLELLPPAGADWMRMLRQRRDDGHAIIPKFEDVRELSMAKIGAANELKRRTDHPHDGGYGLRPDDRRVIEAQRQFDQATADFERLKQLQEVRTAAWHTASQALANVEAWLKHGVPSGVQLLDYDGPEPVLLKGEKGLLDAVENRRRRVREIKASIHAIQSAPLPLSYCKQRLRTQIEPLAQAETPDVSLLIEHDREIVWPMRSVTSEVHAEQRALAFTEVPDTLALFVWLHKDALIAKLDKLLSEEADDGAALTHEQRQQREAEAMGDLLAVERDEAALVWQAQAQGLPVEHRADISPLALLALRLVTAPRADAVPETSAGLSWLLRR